MNGRRHVAPYYFQVSGHMNTVNHVAWNPINGNWFLSTSRDNTVRVYDLRAMRQDPKEARDASCACPAVHCRTRDTNNDTHSNTNRHPTTTRPATHCRTRDTNTDSEIDTSDNFATTGPTKSYNAPIVFYGNNVQQMLMWVSREDYRRTLATMRNVGVPRGLQTDTCDNA